jgi:hypothetical protein
MNGPETIEETAALVDAAGGRGAGRSRGRAVVALFKMQASRPTSPAIAEAVVASIVAHAPGPEIQAARRTNCLRPWREYTGPKGMTDMLSMNSHGKDA